MKEELYRIECTLLMDLKDGEDPGPQFELLLKDITKKNPDISKLSDWRGDVEGKTKRAFIKITNHGKL